MSKESEGSERNQFTIQNIAQQDTSIRDEVGSVSKSFPIHPYEELTEEKEIIPLQKEYKTDQSVEEVHESGVENDSPISPTENYREAFPAVVAKSKKSNKFSLRMTEAWNDETAKEDRVSHLRKTWKRKKDRSNNK